MAFFGNDAVNRVNLHYSVQALAQGAGGTLVGAVLLHAGVPLPMTFVWLAGIIAGRFVLRPLILPIGTRWGLKPLVIAGALLTAVQYLTYAEVRGLGWPLLLNGALGAVASTLYWPSYHAYFASIGDAEHRGHQVGAREAIAAVVGTIGPLATGWALTVLGPHAAFGANAVVLLLSALPLIWAPNVPIAWNAPGAFRAALPGMLLFAADGWMIAGYWFVWSIALFLALGQSFSAYGGAMALAAVVGAISGLVLGRLIDAGHGSRAAVIALAALVVTITLRAVSYGDATLAVIANAAGALVMFLYAPTLGTAMYNQAKRSPCALRFHIAAEGGWDLGGASAGLICAALLWFGAPLGACILLSLFGAFAVFILLRRYYATTATPVAPVVMPELAGSQR
jgi:hypothetical protein